MPLPAISGAEPPAVHINETLTSFKLADGNIPIEPVIIAASSKK